MNHFHCTHCGRFSRPLPRPEPRGDLLKLMQGERLPCPAHQKAEATKRQKRSEARRAHLADWLAAGVNSAKAARLVGVRQ